MMDFYLAEHHARSVFPRKIYLSHPDTERMLQTIRLPHRYLAVRRVVETVFILASLPLTLPLCVLAGLAVRIESRGPILFRQRRPGRDGSPFVMLKFRTMRVDPNAAFRLTAEADERLTRLGRFLRRHHIDELPQLWHVLRGTMSLIGPRPDPMEQAAECARAMPLYHYRQMVRPGITGWGQVNSGYAPDLETSRAKLEDDLYYIANLSSWLDVRIVMRTVRIVLTGCLGR